MKQKLVWPNIYKMEQPIIEKPKTYATMIHDEVIILSDLLDSVYVHDYSYMMSDDAKVWERGNNHERHIKDLIDVLITELCVKPIDLSNIPSGMYVVRLLGKAQQATESLWIRK